jgi:hypothetical protein
VLDLRDLLLNDVLMSKIYLNLIGHLDKIFIVLSNDDLDTLLSRSQQDVVIVLVFEGNFVSFLVQITELVSFRKTLEDGGEES